MAYRRRPPGMKGFSTRTCWVLATIGFRPTDGYDKGMLSEVEESAKKVAQCLLGERVQCRDAHRRAKLIRRWCHQQASLP